MQSLQGNTAIAVIYNLIIDARPLWHCHPPAKTNGRESGGPTIKEDPASNIVMVYLH